MSQSDEPQAKRPRFFIENILEQQNSEPQQLPYTINDDDETGGSGTTPTPKGYVRILNKDLDCNLRFHLLNLAQTFLIERIPANPEELLRRVFQFAVDRALEEGQQRGLRADRLGVLISSAFLEYDIWVPIRPIQSDTVDNIFHRFYIVMQSKKWASLWGAPFTVKVHTVNREALPKKRHLRGRGPAKRKRRVEPIIKHRVKDCNLLTVKNDDNYCLFYALNLTRIHACKEMSSRNFNYYQNTRHDQQKADVIEMMQRTGIPLNLPAYDGKRFIPAIVEYWNYIYREAGLIFKVYVFTEYGSYKPEFKYGPAGFNIPIVLYYTQEHFHGFRKVLFGRSQYCFSCESPYSHGEQHDKKCVTRCINCGTKGLSVHPCPTQIHYSRQCDGCNKTFRNPVCFEQHIEKNYCRKSKYCNDCGEIWDVERNTRRGRQGHVCGEHYCQTCDQYHNPERGCYIAPLSPKQQRPYRLCIFDFECTQHDEVEGRPGRRNHRVNFVAAKVICTACIDSGAWKHPLEEKCRICGPHRTVTFSRQPYTETDVDKQVVADDPLEEFVHWLLTELPKQYATVAFSHFGGRYDMVLTFREIFKLGISPSIIKRGNKLYKMHVKSSSTPTGEQIRVRKTAKVAETIFKDSFNFFPVALGSLVKAFGLSVAEKQFFPHLANRPENYGRVLPQHPPKEDYLYGGMSPEKQVKFMEWYEPERQKPFELDEALPEYALNDVTILTEALLAFREEFLEISEFRWAKLQTRIDEIRRCAENEEDEEECRPRRRRPHQRIIESSSEEEDDEEERGSIRAMGTVAEEGALTESDEEEEDDGRHSPSSDVNAPAVPNNGVTMAGQQKAGGIDILRECLTIASGSMRHFRMNHLRAERMAIVPERGYERADNQSKSALKFLQWYEEEKEVEFRTAHTEGGEKQIGRYKLDGYIEETNIGVEYHGCVWHACKTCFAMDHIMMPNGKTAGKIREENFQRESFLRQHLNGLEVYWECEVEKMRQRDARMRRAFANYHDRGPISLRDCFFGGRTGPFRLHYKAPPGHRIGYLDYTSLYPFTTATSAYPIGHPKVNVIKGREQLVNWRQSTDIPVKGILKVFVIPPDRLDVPVLPVKWDSRLLFPLCRACSKKYPNGCIQPEYKCPHFDDERGWVSTCTSFELAAALENGYRVTHYYRSYEWAEWDDTIFKEYVSEFMAMKIHASGFPPEIQTEEDKERFIKENLERFGVKIRMDKMHPNAAKRFIAKLFLNSLWGRFSLRNGLSTSVVTDSPTVLRQLLDDPKIDISSVDQLTNDVVLITYSPVDEFVEENDSSNVIISILTTSYARLHLHRALQAVTRTDQCNLLYCDTDSILFSYPETAEPPLKPGPHLGQLTVEYPEYKIIEFVSSGCKAYMLVMEHLVTGERKTVLRVKGITLSGDACEKLHEDSFRESVLRFGRMAEDEIVLDEEEREVDDPDDDGYSIFINYPNCLRPNVLTGTVHSVPMTKRYRPVIPKAVVTRGMILTDFGTK